MRAFFGLTPDYIKEVYEQMFFMNYTGNWTITELYNLPVGLRRWFVERTLKQKTEEREAYEKAQNKQGSGR
jgi:hypothetical protein|tara:strand:- start:297 stop:509 length:213 start_codon:yes stop_codon:yes gene_type:complete